MVDQQLVQQSIDNVPGDNFHHKLAHLNRCNCCPRHQTNRPTVFAPWQETPFNDSTMTNCMCDCRHMARWICRQYDWDIPAITTRTNSPTCICEDIA